MTLRYPELTDENDLIKYIEEHYSYGEKEIHASNMLSTMEYNAWMIT